MTKQELAKFLFDNGVYDALQFIDNAENTIIDACYYKEFILELCKDVQAEDKQWKNSWSLEPPKTDNGLSKVNMGELPKFEMKIFNTTISKLRLRDMYIKGYFQSCRNALDAMAQAANAACLASKAKRIETVDFSKMCDVFQQQTYKQAFPVIQNWFSQIQSSPDFVYIDKYCNRTKHTCAVRIKTSFPVFGGDNNVSIEPFFRQESKQLLQLDRKEIVEYIQTAYDFIGNAFKEFIAAIMQEVPKQTFVENRIYSVSVFQQKLKESPDSSFSMAYIEENPDFSSMPDEIEVLLIAEGKDMIYAQNCAFDTIYVQNKSNDNEYIGKYETAGEIGEDSLLRFRKYTKKKHEEGELPLIYQAMMDEKQKNTFYHRNPYVKIKTVSNDDEFIKRVDLPF